MRLFLLAGAGKLHKPHLGAPLLIRVHDQQVVPNFPLPILCLGGITIAFSCSLSWSCSWQRHRSSGGGIPLGTRHNRAAGLLAIGSRIGPRACCACCCRSGCSPACLLLRLGQDLIKGAHVGQGGLGSPAF